MAYAIFDTPAIHGVLGIKELAQAGSEMVPPLVIATAQLLELLDDSSVHTAGPITASSNPIIAGAGTSAGATTRDWASRAIAAHTVDYDTPNARAIDAGVALMAVIRSLAHATARVVNTRRGSASGACSVQVRVGQSRSGQANTRLHHKVSKADQVCGIACATPLLTTRNDRCSLSTRRPRHPKKEVEDALEFAEAHRWLVESPRPGHPWGRATCGRPGHDCLVWIWSTPRNAANHGKQIRRAAYRCDAKEDSDD